MIEEYVTIKCTVHDSEMVRKLFPVQDWYLVLLDQLLDRHTLFWWWHWSIFRFFSQFLVCISC